MLFGCVDSNFLSIEATRNSNCMKVITHGRYARKPLPAVFYFYISCKDCMHKFQGYSSI